jgi:hypothetical protein
MRVYFHLFVNEVNAALKEEVEEVPWFLVKTTCQVRGQSQCGRFPVTHSIVNLTLTLM